ncbi:MAG: HEPN domain-containing protein [Actinobacteria bacterium]|nr:HEPN domain-containing protein [Actinomycetota bacterium]
MYNKINYPKTHKIVELVRSNEKLINLLDKYIDDFKIIDAFYIPTRYPDGIPGRLTEGLPSEADAKDSLELAEAVFNEIKRLLE